MIEANVAAILIAVIGGGFGVWSSYVSSKNQKATKNITDVLTNTKTPVDSLDQVVRLLQEELTRANKQHDDERNFFRDEIARVRNEHRRDREDWEAAEKTLQNEIDELIGERIQLLDQIKELQGKLSELESQVQKSLDSVSSIKNKEQK